MNLKSIAAISALLLGAASMAAPAFAQTAGAPGKGTGADVTRAAPQSLPDAKPKPLPKVMPVDEVEERMRELDKDATIIAYCT